MIKINWIELSGLKRTVSIITKMVLIIPPIEKIQTWIHESFAVSAMILGKKVYLNSWSKLVYFVARPSPRFFPLFYIN